MTSGSRRWGCYGGPIETPNIDRIGDGLAVLFQDVVNTGLRYTRWHTTALA